MRLGLFLLGIVLCYLLSNCEKEKELMPQMPKIENLEVGLNNNEIGVVGRDFHFNADIIAGDKIEKIQVKILPRSGESYSKVWRHEITWEQYKDARNAHVHEHFMIPGDAAEGKYDFVVIVNDQNGTILEEKRGITIIFN